MTTVDELAAQTPSLEELLTSTLVPCWNGPIDRLSTANAMTLLVAPIPLRILSVAISWEYWNLAASDTAYWSANLNKGTGPTGFASIATRTTQNTGANANGPVVARKPWTFDAAAWGNADLAAGELLRVTFSPAGTVNDLDMPFTVTTRYRPL